MQFLTDNSIYVTLILALIIMIALIAYISRVDSRLRKVEHELGVDGATTDGIHSTKG